MVSRRAHCGNGNAFVFGGKITEGLAMSSGEFFTISARLSAIIAAEKNIERRKLALMHSVGNALATAFRENFHDLDAKKSVYGHNFYTREGEGKTDYELSPDGESGAVVVKSYQMAHALNGGVVSAKNVNFLSIPVSERAKKIGRGARTSGIDKMFFVKRPYGGFLATANGKGKNQSLTVHYVLKKSVKHNPRPYVIPDEAKLEAAVKKGIADAGAIL